MRTSKMQHNTEFVEIPSAVPKKQRNKYKNTENSAGALQKEYDCFILAFKFEQSLLISWLIILFHLGDHLRTFRFLLLVLDEITFTFVENAMKF